MEDKERGCNNILGISGVVAARVENMKPELYRLCRKKNGALVRQGCFTWQEGTTHGHEWRDLQTVEEE